MSWKKVQVYEGDVVQQILITLADYYQLGWQVVDNNELHELVSSDDDAKHIKKAEKVA